MDIKKSRYKSDYSLRTLAYYQRKGGIYNDLITILQRIRDERPVPRSFPSPNKILNIVSEAYDAIIDVCSDDEGHIHSFTEENIASYLESFSVILYGSVFSPIPGLFSTHDEFLQQVDLCVLASLMSQTPELKEIVSYITEPVEKENPNLYTQFVLLIESKAEVTTQLDYLKRELQAKEQMIKLKDSEIKDKDIQIKQLTELNEVLSTTVERYKNDETPMSNFDRILNLDTILGWIIKRKHYKLADQVITMLKDLARKTATDKDFEKIESVELELLSNYSELSVINNNMGIGSNILTGVASNPLMPMGYDQNQLTQKFIEILNNGTQRENKD